MHIIYYLFWLDLWLQNGIPDRHSYFIPNKGQWIDEKTTAGLSQVIDLHECRLM